MTTLPEASKKWTPVRRGKIYCSPGCGGQCTKANYDKAVRTGKRLVKRLGPGWRYEVWDNLGWWVSVTSKCGRIKVSPAGYEQKEYMAMIGDPDIPGGRWVAHSATPEQAIAQAISKGKAELHKTATLLKGL